MTAAALPPTRRIARVLVEPTLPPGWTDLGDGTWSWLSSGQTVTCSIFVRPDCTTSAPHVSGVGKMWLVVSEVKRAMTAVDALLDYIVDRQTWERAQ